MLNKIQVKTPPMKCDKSIVFAIFTFSLAPLDAISGELILDQSLLEKASKQARENPYRIKQALGSKEVSAFDLGNPVTPFFQHESSKTTKRRYRSGKNCFEVSFLKTLNLATKTDCRQLMEDLKLPGYPDFHAAKVSDLLKPSASGFGFWDASDSYRLKGFVHTRETIEMDQRILGLQTTDAFPTQSFLVKTEAKGSVTLDSKSGLSITQQTSMTIGKIGILDQRSETINNSISRDLKDWIFTDGKGRVIVINKLMLPRPLQDSLLAIQPDFSQFLEDLESRSSRSAVCFRDSWMGNTDQDCQQMVIKKIRPFELHSFNLLMVDFQSSSVSPIL
jgi:hypothetical protein